MNMQVLEARRDVSGGYKVDVTRVLAAHAGYARIVDIPDTNLPDLRMEAHIVGLATAEMTGAYLASPN